MEIVHLHEKTSKLCFRKTGDVVRLMADGSGPFIVAADKQLKPGPNSGLFELGIDYINLVNLETGATVQTHLSTRVVWFPNAACHLGKVSE
jgi:hypothetical protein